VTKRRPDGTEYTAERSVRIARATGRRSEMAETAVKELPRLKQKYREEIRPR
jgi:hypothetical protein